MEVLGFSGNQVVMLVQAGTSGIAFLFVAMSFLLVRKEQDREGEARERVLASIKHFNVTAFSFAFLAALMIIVDMKYRTSNNEIPQECRDQLARTSELVENEMHTVDSLKQLISNALDKCK